AITILEDKGYKIHYVPVPQLGTTHQTTVKVLARADEKWVDMVKDPSRIKSITSWSEDNGRTMLGIQPPLAVNPKRVQVKYAEDGGDKADGVIYVRPGVADVSIGTNRYAQVRI